MLLSILTVLQLVRVILTMQNPTNINNDELKKYVRKYYDLYPKSNMKAAGKTEIASTSKININKLSLDVNDIVDQSIYNFQYVVFLLKMTKINQLDYENNRNTHIKIVKISIQEQKICAFTPRYIDYIYVFSNKTHIIFELIYFYSFLCTEWPTILSEKCHTSDESEYKCNSGALRLIYETIKNYKMFDDKYEFKNLEISFNMSVDYMIGIYKFLNASIDKTLLIHKSPQYDKNYIISNVRQGIHSTESTNVAAGKGASTSIGTKVINTPKIDLKSINSEYIKTMRDDECAVSELPPNDSIRTLDSTELTYVLMVYFFKMFDVHIKYYMSALDVRPGHPGFIDKMDEIYNGFCDYARVIVFHFQYYNEPLLSSLYLSHCNHHIDFYDFRCRQMDKKPSFDLQCIAQSLRDKLFIGNLFSTKVNDKCISNLFKYVKTVHDKINTYYKKDSSEYPLMWTSFNFLSGNLFLFGEMENPELRVVKKLTTNVEGFQIPMQIMYNLILPWHLNMEFIINFHNIILEKIERCMNLYLYRYVTVIIVYFKIMEVEINNTILNNLKNGMDWYITISKHFYKYLNISDTYKRDKRTTDIVDVFQNIDKNFLSKLDNYIPPEEKRNIMENLNMNLFFNLRQGTESELKKRAYDYVNLNCKHSLQFVDNFTEIVKKSLETQTNIEKMNKSVTIDSLCKAQFTQLFRSKNYKILTKDERKKVGII